MGGNGGHGGGERRARSAGYASGPYKVKVCTKILGKVEECGRAEAHFMGWPGALNLHDEMPK